MEILITLMAFEVVIVLLSILATHMLVHKYEQLYDCLAKYGNKRKYTTKKDLLFVETIMRTYIDLWEQQDEPDLEQIIKESLGKEKIGKFSYMGVRHIAIQLKGLMWGVLAVEVAILEINELWADKISMSLVASSLLLTVIMAVYGLIKRLKKKENKLIQEAIYYIEEVYPLQKEKQLKMMKQQQHSRQTPLSANQSQEDKRLKAQDIEEILQKL